MGSKSTSLPHATVYRYQRPLPVLDWIFFGTWIAVVVVATVVRVSQGKSSWGLPLLFPPLAVSYILSRRASSVEIRQSSINCEVLPGKRATILYASILELRESELGLLIVHQANPACASTYLPKPPFTPRHWKEIVDAIAERTLSHSPFAAIEVHSGLGHGLSAI